MKRKSKVSLLIASLMLLGGVSGCSDESSTLPSSSFSQTQDSAYDMTEDEEQIYQIYLKAQSSGYTGTYEEWLASIKGEKGDKGDKGDTGETGPQGEQGIQGEKGDTGEQGPAGEDGEDGLTPYIGDNGNWWIGTTDTGVSATGAAGEGSKGEKGDTGEQGPAGEDGEDGLTPYIGDNGNWWIGTTDTGVSATGSAGEGSKGEKGDTGEAGQDGKDGLTPYIGDNGNWWIGTTDTGVAAQGSKGETGSDGKDGKDGSQVLTDTADPKSIEGKDGDVYINTTTWDLFTKSNGVWTKIGNIKGEAGQDGQTPFIGYNGNWWIGTTDTGVSATGTSTTGSDGKDGADGSQVLTDTSDPKSIEGKDGDVYINTTTWDIFSKNDGVWTKIGNIKGDTGEDGNTPYIGENGNWWIGTTDTGVTAKGDTGETGAQGEQGIQGEKGEKGDKGDTGATGADGLTPYIGTNGNWWIGTTDTGVTAQGSKGDTGSQGEQGIQGEKGEKGDTGEAGQDGEDGTDGSSAYQLYLKYHKAYAGTEEEWVNDLAEGKLNTKVIVTFVTNSNSKIDPIETEYRSIIAEPISPIRDGGNFISWQLNGKVFDFSTPITESIKLTAKYSSSYSVNITNGKLSYGSYPQTHVNDSTLINTLNTLTTTNSKGWYEYNGKEYAKVSGNPYNSSYTFSDGTTITSGTNYWFKVEPIQWTVLDTTSNTTIITDKILEPIQYYSSFDNRTINDNTIYANNYEYSNIRAWMNGYDGSSYHVNDYTGKGFIDLAFSYEESDLLLFTLVDNSIQSTGDDYNPYLCNDTNDRVFTLSYEEATTYWTNDSDRVSQPTDYALAKGALHYTYGDYGAYSSYFNKSVYWLRSPNPLLKHAGSVYYGGAFNCSDYVNFAYRGVRPALNIIVD